MKLSASYIYYQNPNYCLHCGNIVPYKKHRGIFCNIQCSNKYKNKNRKGKLKGNYVVDNVDWKNVQEKHNNGMLISKIPKEFNFSGSTLQKAIRLGLLTVVDTDIHKKERRKNQSASMVKVHAEGKHIGWQHINKKTKRSYPEEFFSRVLKDNGFYDKYTIIEKMPFHKYTLDFVIADLKLNIEIDGQQHFRTEKSILHDNKRNDFLISKGWLIYRIAWVNMAQHPKLEIEKFIHYMNNESKKNVFYNIEDVISKIPKRKYKNIKEYLSKRKEKSFENNKKYIDIIKNSNIDFSKFGWVKKVSILINKKEQHINKWMKNFMPDFFNKKCFKRESKNGLSKVRKYGSREDALNNRKKLTRLTTINRIKLMKDLGISLFSKGWCRKLMDLFNINKNNVNRWVKKNENELFLEGIIKYPR